MAEFVWGLLAGDLNGERVCSLETMNDIELVYWPETKDYSVSIEKLWSFESPKAHHEQLLAAFTRWMEEQGYDTTQKPDFPEFTGRFKTIEQAYANFKVLVEL